MQACKLHLVNSDNKVELHLKTFSFNVWIFVQMVLRQQGNTSKSSKIVQTESSFSNGIKIHRKEKLLKKLSGGKVSLLSDSRCFQFFAKVQLNAYNF